MTSSTGSGGVCGYYPRHAADGQKVNVIRIVTPTSAGSTSTMDLQAINVQTTTVQLQKSPSTYSLTRLDDEGEPVTETYYADGITYAILPAFGETATRTINGQSITKDKGYWAAYDAVVDNGEEDEDGGTTDPHITTYWSNDCLYTLTTHEIGGVHGLTDEIELPGTFWSFTTRTHVQNHWQFYIREMSVPESTGLRLPEDIDDQIMLVTLDPTNGVNVVEFENEPQF